MDNLSHFRSLDELIRALDRERRLLHALFQDRKKLSFSPTSTSKLFSINFRSVYAPLSFQLVEYQ